MDVRYHKQKMKALSREMQEEYLKELKLKEELAYWRHEMLKAYRDERQKPRGTFLISEIV